ncbi:Short chain dehydrogenase-like protein 14 [Elsinoe fawcettii]|nr:Short chain dehydrogenase-like protein 14 [Elsinoe fawcettii]
MFDVGGTAGIGASTLKEFFECTIKPKAYIVGRNQKNAEELIEEVTSTSIDAECYFIKADVTLLKNVDDVCDQIMQKEKKINILFLSAGFMSMRGRTETSEGLDRKMSVNYYARARFIHNLMPLLTDAAKANELSRVLSVLAAGSEGHIRTDDLSLKHNYTVHACMAHCVVMNDFMMEELSKRFPLTAFSHSYPGTVKSGITNELGGPARLAVKILYAVSSPWIIHLRESGERHFFQITSAMYPPRRGSGGVDIPDGFDICEGSDGEKGSGAYLLDWDAQSTGDQEILKPYRENGLGKTIWDHTMEVFRAATSKKRPADSPAEEDFRARAPVGWRAG